MTPSFRILQVVPTLDVSYGGPSRNAFELFKAFNARPGERTSRMLVMRRARGVTVVDDERHPAEAAYGIHGLRTAAWLLRNVDIVVIHGVYFWWTVPISLFCLLTRLPYAVTPHGSLGARQRKYSPRKKKIFYALGGMASLRSAQVIVVGSEAERADVSEAFPQLCVRVGGVGVPAPEAPEPREASRPLALLSVCRLHRKKRIDVCIRAVALLRRAGFDVVYRVAGVGDDELRKMLINLAEWEGVADIVHFLGLKVGAEKAALFASADVFLVPSVEENFGIALAEALSFGLPAVATQGVAAAAVMDGGCGRVIAEPTARLVAAAVRELATEPEYGVLRQRAYAVACRCFAWEPVADNWASLLGVAVYDRPSHSRPT